jgi:hypothetical protein
MNVTDYRDDRFLQVCFFGSSENVKEEIKRIEKVVKGNNDTSRQRHDKRHPEEKAEEGKIKEHAAYAANIPPRVRPQMFGMLVDRCFHTLSFRSIHSRFPTPYD